MSAYGNTGEASKSCSEVSTGTIDWTAPVADDHIEPLQFEVTTWPTLDELTAMFASLHNDAEAAYNGDGSWGTGTGGHPYIRPRFRNALGYISAYRATGIEIYKQRAQAALDSVLQEQEVSGEWGYWMDGTYHLSTTPDNSPQYMNGLGTAAMAKAYKYLGDQKYLDAANKCADFLSTLDYAPPNKSLFAAWGLASLYEITGEQNRLERAIDHAVWAAYECKQEQPYWGIQLPSGGWWDTHGQKIWYHGINTRGLIVLHSVMPAGHPDYTKIEQAAYRAMNHIRLRLKSDGTTLIYPTDGSSAWWCYNNADATVLAQLRLNWPVMDAIRCMANNGYSAPAGYTGADAFNGGAGMMGLGNILEAYSSSDDPDSNGLHER